KDIDPLVERVILRCLEKDPSKRLASAKQVADALPGGDPLAAALAMGEPPSPAMVAAAGSKEGMKPMYAVACLIAVVVGLIVNAALGDKISIYPSLLREYSPEDLTRKAQDITRQLGYTNRPADSASGYKINGEYGEYVRKNIPSDKQRDLFATVQSPLIYWYRQSPQYLQSRSAGWVDDYDPPREISGMIGVWLDSKGRLTRFEAVPPQVDQSSDTPQPPDWKPLFIAAGLDPTSFSLAPSQWAPLAVCDVRAAWTGTHPALPQIPLRIEAAAYRGKPIYFQLIWPWTSAARMQEIEQTTANIVFIIIVGLLLLGASLLVRHNFREGRGDRRGAFRLAAFIFFSSILSWLFGAHHSPDIAYEIAGFFGIGVSRALLWAGFGWVLYIALEPYVRRRWPVVLISWNRVLSGNLRDPKVGRDLLMGTLMAIAAVTILNLPLIFYSNNTVSMDEFAREALPGFRFLLASGFAIPPLWIPGTLLCLFLLFVLRTLVRWQWLATVILVLLFVLLLSPPGGGLLMRTFNGLFPLLIIFILLRFGYFAFVTFFCVIEFLSYPMTLHFSAWYTNSALVVVGTILAIAIYGFHTALGGQKVFTGKLLEE
ncbi:MAG: hypothetical protein HOP19_18360, partial [Acidobacteria bacterium]|nr:hypothetical protein [Acidobacteriota bacterium]